MESITYIVDSFEEREGLTWRKGGIDALEREGLTWRKGGIDVEKGRDYNLLLY